jgi:hypothetical protein
MELFSTRLSKSQIRVTRELYIKGKKMNRVSSCSVVLSFVLLLLSGVVSISASRSYALAGETNVSISSTSTIFNEGFEWTFPEPNWVVADANTDNGGDYWDDTSMRSHGGDRSIRYDQGVDALDDDEIQATAGYQVVPEFRSFLILLFFIVATLLAVRAPRKRARGAVA